MSKPSPKTPSTSRNVIWNWTSLGCETLIALALCPWLIYCLGTDVYGWWVLLIGLSGLGGVLDLGIRQSLSRFVAFDIAKGDRDALGGHLMTAGLLMMVLGLLAAVLTFGLGWTYHERLIASGMLLPSDWIVALGILCLSVLVNYPNTVLESWLTGTERFDRLNQTRVPQEVLRGIFVAIVAGGGGGLTAMAWATLGAFTIGSLARFVLVFWAFPSIANWTVPSRSVATELIGFSCWNFLRGLGLMVPRRLAPMMIGAVCGPSSVTVFAIATRLLSLVSTPVMSTMGVRGPQATKLFAKNDKRGLRELVLYSCRATSVLTSGLVIALVIFSPSVCDLWLGRTFPELTPTLAVLGFGLWFSLNQIVTRLTLVAAAEHRWLTYLSLMQAGLFLAIGSVAMTLQVPLFDELMGWALLLSALEAITQGVAVAIVSKRVIGTSGIALLGATVSPMWRVMPAALLGLAIQRFWPIESGLELLFAGSICGVVWLTCCRSLLFPNFRPSEFMASQFERRALRLAR